MSFRYAVRAVAACIGAATLAGSVSALAFTAPAWANGEQISTAAQCATSVTGPCAHAPFSSGQHVNIVVPANVTIPGGSSIHVLECAQAVMTATSDASALPLCDGLTINGDSVTSGSDGSVTYDATSTTGYQIYALPDSFSLGEPSTNQPQCDTTHLCVLYIGTDQTHPYSSAHVWSQVFQVSPNATDSGDTTPGDGTPEVPLAIGLPLLALGMVGGTMFFRRRRSAAGSKA